ncbi:tRNA (carboxymethyluridine(34)-5-O)-methyltransferase [Ricinus communis]|uniref:S-adenosylmethionine-dependent methyltransferase, putative n=1 Tax=Ricinus communis TaxID=3988 RepID=B9RJD9_RICCO|nr:tRNA (carboxymethyluridine(34)-5-O)-methyltransferase [Ricinus communis]EEF48441.1 S-adenosylmethionine-dependent methyltransferase, putative [Ricinus communis]|eukprot:XP_002513858.1 tRNA (carboxymethyluridine(34)-5-O)-methyltransferase [Ricinus communis]
MIFDVLRASRFSETYRQAFARPIIVIGRVCLFGIFRAMREIKVKGPSGLSNVASDGESQIQLSLSADEKQVCSSSSVQSTPEIEKKYVHHVYDAIAPHFSSTRFAKWPKVATFLNSLPSGSLILDAGCGNGKYLGLNPDCYFIGCDISAPLIKICADRGHEVLVGDAVNLPYRTGFSDAAISIAVLHHLSTENRRKKAIEELVRVVKKGGLVLITVWAVEQEDGSLVAKWTPLSQKYVEEWIGPGSPRVRSPSSFTLESIPETEENNSKELIQDSEKNADEEFMKTMDSISQTEHNSVFKDEKNAKNQQEYFVPWHLPYHRAEVSGASACALASGLAKKDDKKGAVVYNRYYHVFSEGELERLVTGMKNAVVVDRFFDKSNWCVILEKTS